MLIASKLEEIYAPVVCDFVYICDGAFTEQELLDMEKLICKSLDFQLIAHPLHLEFVRVFNTIASITEPMHSAAKLFTKYCMFNLKLLSELPSTLAACICYKVCTNAKKWDLCESPLKGSPKSTFPTPFVWSDDLVEVTRLTENDILTSNCWRVFEEHLSNDAWNKFSAKHSALFRTYSRKYHGVSMKIYGPKCNPIPSVPVNNELKTDEQKLDERTNETESSDKISLIESKIDLLLTTKNNIKGLPIPIPEPHDTTRNATQKLFSEKIE
jgi:hypothetical protein